MLCEVPSDHILSDVRISCTFAETLESWKVSVECLGPAELAASTGLSKHQ
jgi:hypothetical protein